MILLLIAIFLLILIIIKLKNKLTRITAIILIALFYLTSITPSADLIIYPLENNYPSLNIESLSSNLAYNFVFLTGNHQSDIIRASEALRLINYAKENNINYHLIISGRNLFDRSVHQEDIEQYFINRGVPRNRIVYDNDSNTTNQSADYLSGIETENNKTILITSAYHMPRSILTLENDQLIPAPTDFQFTGRYSILDFFPNTDNWNKINLATHEYIGILAYNFHNLLKS